MLSGTTSNVEPDRSETKIWTMLASNVKGDDMNMTSLFDILKMLL